MTRHQPAHKGLSEARRLAEAKGRPFEVWEGDGQQPQRFTCPDHPGLALSIKDLRTSPPNPAAWLYVVPHGTNVTAQPKSGLDALNDAYAAYMTPEPPAIGEAHV